MYYELADTLIALVQSIEPPVGSGLIVTEAEIQAPLEVYSGMEHGKLVFYGSPPHTQWRSGVMPAIHTSTLRITLEDEAAIGPEDGVGR